MENWIVILIFSFIFDLLITLLINSVFRLKFGAFKILFYQVFFIVPTVIYIFCPISFFVFLLLKIFMGFIFCLVTLEVYSVKTFFLQYLAYLAVFFAIYGFGEFLVLFFKTVINEAFNQKFGYILDIAILILLVLFYFALYFLFNTIGQRNSTKKYLAKVSFSLFGKHIKITGLFDSGNCLFDPKTQKPVMVLSVYALQGVLPRQNYQKVLSGDFSGLNVSHCIKYVTVGQKEADMPIIDIGSVVLHKKEGDVKKECVVGFVSQRFDEYGGFDALLHREF